MKSILLIVVALFLWGCVDARPSFFTGFASSPTGSSLNYNGINLGMLTSDKTGKHHELSIYGAFNIPASVKILAVTVSNSSSGTFNISQLFWNQTLSSVNTYIYGNVRLNASTYISLYVGSLYVLVYTSNGLAAVGAFGQNTYEFFSALYAANVVGTQPPSGHNNFALSYAYVYSTTTNFPTDIPAANVAYLNSLVINAAIVHTVTDATTGDIYGPATNVQTAGSIQTLTAGTQVFLTSGAALETSQTLSALFQKKAYFQIDSSSYPNGDLRGQAYPLIYPRRREVPIALTISDGSYTGDFASLYRATQYGLDNNKNSYITISPNTTDKAFTGIFTIQLPVKKGNILALRYLTLELNAKGDGSTWNFYYYNFVTKTFDSLGTFSNNFWTYFFVDSVAIVYLNSNDQVLLKVTSTSATGPLLIDELTIRPWVPHDETNSVLRNLMRYTRSTLQFF